MIKQKITFLLAVFILASLVLVSDAGAQGATPIDNPAPNYLVSYDFQQLIVSAISIALYFAGTIALLFLIIGGFQYIMARGNEEATEKAKKTISGAVLGIVIIVMSFAIVTIVNNLLVAGTPGNGAVSPPAGTPTPPGGTPPPPSSQSLAFTRSSDGNNQVCGGQNPCDLDVGRISGGSGTYTVASIQPNNTGTRPFMQGPELLLNIPLSVAIGNYSVTITVADSRNASNTRSVSFNFSVQD